MFEYLMLPLSVAVGWVTAGVNLRICKHFRILQFFLCVIKTAPCKTAFGEGLLWFNSCSHKTITSFLSKGNKGLRGMWELLCFATACQVFQVTAFLCCILVLTDRQQADRRLLCQLQHEHYNIMAAKQQRRTSMQRLWSLLQTSLGM
jgi:hypothetical protein